MLNIDYSVLTDKLLIKRIPFSTTEYIALNNTNQNKYCCYPQFTTSKRVARVSDNNTCPESSENCYLVKIQLFKHVFNYRNI